MARFFSSDAHFDHANIIDLCARPFGSVEEMNLSLVERWNAVVGDEDEVWCLGDVALGKGTSGLAWASLLNGHKILVPGNHDRVAAYRKGADSFRKAYHDAGFEQILPGPLDLALGNRTVLVDHFPYRGDSRAAERYRAQRPVDRGAWLVHGHVHGRWRQAGRMLNVGVDAWGGRPVSETALLELMAAGPRDTPPLSW